MNVDVDTRPAHVLPGERLGDAARFRVGVGVRRDAEGALRATLFGERVVEPGK